MSLPINPIGAEALEAIEKASKTMDAILELSVKVGELVVRGLDPSEIRDLHEDELDNLVGELVDLPLTYRFSGFGFTPVILPDGEQAVGYTEGRHMSGRFYWAHISDPIDEACVSREEVEHDYGIGDEESLEFYDEEDEARARELLDSLHTPPPGVQLIVDFEVERRPKAEIPIVGQCIRALGYGVHHRLPALGLSIHGIDVAGPEPLEPEEVLGCIEKNSQKIRRMAKNPSFRELNPEQQKLQIDALAEKINEVLEPGKVFVLIDPEELYSPNGNGMKLIEVDDDLACMPFSIMSAGSLHASEIIGTVPESHDESADTVDSLDTKLCLIGETDEASRKRIGLASTVVWIPIRDQALIMRFID